MKRCNIRDFTLNPKPYYARPQWMELQDNHDKKNMQIDKKIVRNKV
jgi:hypothetical protein